MIKKGSLLPTIAVLGTVLLIFVALWAFTVGSVIVKEGFDELAPVVRGIGEVTPGNNISEYADYGLNPLESIINNFQIFASIIYVVGIIFVFSMAFMFRSNLNGWTIAFYLVCVIALITISVVMSNAYEDLYDGTDDLGLALREASTLSYLVLYSPTIMAIVAFIAGIIMMTGGNRGGYGGV